MCSGEDDLLISRSHQTIDREYINYMNSLDIIKQLELFGERQGAVLLEVEKYICEYLDSRGNKYLKERFMAEIPSCNALLYADDISIECRGVSFNSGEINSKAHILSSTISSRLNFETPNINFNPFCEGISAANFYNAPAIAISKQMLPLILGAKAITGQVSVTKVRTDVAHILVGNITKPKKIIFAHYDSISIGAMDNASGVAVCLDLITKYPNLLVNCLFVFDPNEELSYDELCYWGHGFRVFQARHKDLFDNAELLLPVDCIGNGPAQIDRSRNILKLALPITEFDTYTGKMLTIYADINGLMSVYHSSLDTSDSLSQEYLDDASEKLYSLLA